MECCVFTSISSLSPLTSHHNGQNLMSLLKHKLYYLVRNPTAGSKEVSMMSTNGEIFFPIVDGSFVIWNTALDFHTIKPNAS